MDDLNLQDIKNPILKSFLSISHNKSNLQSYLNEPSLELKKKIETDFKDYYIRIRLITYLSKTLHYAAQHYDKRQRLWESTLIHCNRQVVFYT